MDTGRSRGRAEALGSEEANVERVYTDVITRPPQLTGEQVEELERAVANWGPTRRAGLAVLAKSGEWLHKTTATREGAVTLSVINQSISDYLQHLDAVKSIMETAALSIEVALCAREDLADIKAEAERELLTQPH